MSLRISTFITFVVIGLSILAFHANAAPLIASDSQVADIISKSWGICRQFRLGESAVGNKVMNARLMSDSELDLLRKASRAGLVVLEEGPDTPPANMFLTGVIKQIKVMPSVAGLEASKNSNCTATDPQFLQVQIHSLKVDKIISNEETKNAVNTFRVVKGIATGTFTNAGLRLNEQEKIRASPAPEAGKFIMLLKFDSFTSQWKLVNGSRTYDIARLNSDFTTNFVQDYLAGSGH